MYSKYSAALFSVAFGAAALVVGTSSEADQVSATRFDILERSHVVEILLDRGHATLVATRTVENVGPKSDQATFHLDIPEGSVAVRLRTAGTNGTWFEGELLEAEEAAKRYRELTGIGGYYPKDPALLSWRSATHLALQVFPVPARSTKVVEYTLRMPLTYEDGRYKLLLPRLGTEAVPARLRISPRHAEDHVEVNGVEVASTNLVSAAREVEVLLAPRHTTPIDGALASFGFAAGRHLVHSRIAAASKLSDLPAGASVVVLLDTSRSMDELLPSALGATRAYLAEFPGANVEVLTFDRTVHSPFGGPLPARDALARLYGFAPSTANGSAIDEAISRADVKLAKANGARRILILTDLRTRNELTPERFAAYKLTSNALVHLAQIGAGVPSLERDDESGWAALPRKTGGLFWNAKSSESSDGTDREVFSEWVRPKRIDRLAIKGLPEAFESRTVLKEGEGIDFFGIAASGVKQVVLEGELWSKPIRWSMNASDDEGRRWAGFVFGSSLLAELSEPEQMTLAMHGRAVSPVTSYLAIEPGVRPSNEGLEWSGTGEGGGGFGEGRGLGMVGRVGHGVPAKFDRQAFLDRALARALGACQATSANAKLESTLAEIVDIHVEAEPKQSNACITEQLWSVSLPQSFIGEHDDWTTFANR